jgi:hypothetical protein
MVGDAVVRFARDARRRRRDDDHVSGERTRAGNRDRDFGFTLPSTVADPWMLSYDNLVVHGLD